MSELKNPKYAKEFAYRTIINYYNLKGLISTDKDKVSYNRPKEIEFYLNDMKSNGFETSEKYEVTLLLNSLIGLLIFPQQTYYNKSKDDSIGFRNLPVLLKYINLGKPIYKNTYKDKQDNSSPEKRTPANVLRHMRNAVAHDKISIYPVNSTNNKITSIIFTDCKRDNNKLQEFSINISVDDLEPLMFEIAKYLISFEE